MLKDSEKADKLKQSLPPGMFGVLSGVEESEGEGLVSYANGVLACRSYDDGCAEEE